MEVDKLASKTKVTNKLKFRFSDKHKDYIRRCKVASINVAEGAVRAGKTVDNIFAFAMELERTEDKIHIATGNTGPSAKIIIGESNGYGLEHIFRGRCRWGKFKGNDCIYINTKTGLKQVIFAGGGKADSYKSIRGNSYGMWIATEINLHHEETIKECFKRTFAAKNRKTFWDLNPSNPEHRIYVNYIDKYAAKQENGEFKDGYYNYEHFTIYDNINISDERREEIVSTYEVGSIDYKRDIRGERTAAEGLIYTKFARDPDFYLIRPEEVGNITKINIGVDFSNGGGANHAMVATAMINNYEKIVVLGSRVYPGTYSDYELAEEYVDFLKEIEGKYSNIAYYTYGDSAKQSGLRELRSALARHGLNRQVWDSQKRTINERIRVTLSLINTERFNYTSNAEDLRLAMCSALWDEKSSNDKRLKDLSTDVDSLDAFEYSFSSEIENLINYRAVN